MTFWREDLPTLWPHLSPVSILSFFPTPWAPEITGLGLTGVVEKATVWIQIDITGIGVHSYSLLQAV